KPPASKAAPEGLPELAEAARAALLALEQQGKSTAEQLAGAEERWRQTEGVVRESGRNLAGHLQDLLGAVPRGGSGRRELLWGRPARGGACGATGCPRWAASWTRCGRRCARLRASRSSRGRRRPQPLPRSPRPRRRPVWG